MIYVLQVMDNIAVHSGVSSVVLNIYRNIDRKQIQFDFLVSNRTADSYEKEILQYEGRIVYLGNPLSVKTLISACKNSRRFFEENSERYTAVHLHSPTIAEMTIRYGARYGIKNIIIHSHSSMFSNILIKKAINKILTARLDSFATHYWYCSDEAGKFLFGDDFKSKPNSQWIRNGIDVESKRFDERKRMEVRKKYGVDDCKIACHISNFSAAKNTGFLADIIDQVTSRDSSWCFLFVGDGPWRKMLERQIDSAGLSSYCIFTGISDQVSLFLNAADVLLLPSIKEGLPVVAIEAQACGLPCLLSNTITRQVDVYGVQYLPLKHEEWIKALCGFHVSTDQERMAASVDFSDSKFNIQKEVRRIETLYKNMVK